MTRNRTEVGFFMTVGVMCAVAGCAGFGHRSERWATAPPPPEAPSILKADEPSGQAVLAAVEEFLERTREFEFSRVPADMGPEPTGEAVANALPPSGTGRQTIERPPTSAAGGRSTPPEVHEALANTQLKVASAPPSRLMPALPVVQFVSLRTESPVELAAAEPARTRTTNEPLDVGASETLSLADRFLSHLSKQAVDAGDFETEWRLRLTELALNRDSRAVEVSSDLSPGARHLLLTLIRLAISVRGVAHSPLLVDEEPLRRVDELRDALTARADLSVNAVALCRKVVTFGVYEEMADEEFVAGRSIQTIVYSEIRHFQPEVSDDDRYVTRLGTRLEVFKPDGTSVWTHEEPEIVDSCRRKRTDFFIAQRVTLLATLPAGEYVLKVFVEDKNSGRAGEAVHPLKLTTALAVASRR
jgi:hypothetical protein